MKVTSLFLFHGKIRPKKKCSAVDRTASERNDVAKGIPPQVKNLAREILSCIIRKFCHMFLRE